MRASSAVSIVLVSAVASLAPTRALAAPHCVPQAAGVPGAAGGPVWWGGASSAVDDPRWRGASTFAHVSAGMRFRALVDGTGADRALLLSWQVFDDPTAGDGVYVGFFDTAAGQGNMFKMTRLQNAALADGGTSDAGTTFNATTVSAAGWYWTGTAWATTTSLPNFPSWLGDDGRVNVSCSSSSSSACDAWTIRLRVPLVASGGNWASPQSASGLQLPTTFKLFYEIKSVENQLSPTYSALEWVDPSVDLTDPTNFSDENQLGSPRFPDVAGWPEVGLDTTDPTCIKGVSFDASTTTIVNAASGASGGAHVDLTGANTFHLEPVNHTGTTRAQALLVASLRVADWGPAQYQSPTWRALPGCGAATGGTGTVADGVTDDLSCTWTPTADERCAYDAALGCSSTLGAKYRYQCYLVELTTATSDLYFPNGSDVFCEAPPTGDGGATGDGGGDASTDGAARADAADASGSTDARLDAGAPNDAASDAPIGSPDAATDGHPDAAVSSEAGGTDTTQGSGGASGADARDASAGAPGGDASAGASGGDAGMDAAPTLGGDAADARPLPSTSGPSGCGCALDAGASHGRVLPVILFAGLVLARRRRRTK